MPTKSTIYLICGCNGAGKTTFAQQFLAEEVHCVNFFNPDFLAQGLSPTLESGAIKAGRLILQRVRQALKKRESFGLESALSGKSYVRLLKEAREFGYEIEVHYQWISSAERAVERVRLRRMRGGHDVPEIDVRRRFERSLKNLFSDYLPLAQRWVIWDNNSLPGKPLATSATHSILNAKRLLNL
ncbi:MAG TPA: hypothetical protein VK530_02975 [Candidatus Acidoferrum sp.]|nr:hypothetical protein [Candidatus Acidoferrum sp.]